MLKTYEREKERKKKHSERLPNDPAYKYLGKSEKSVHNIKKSWKKIVCLKSTSPLVMLTMKAETGGRKKWVLK